MGLGIALFVHLWWLTLIYVLLFWLYYERIIFAEEAYLREKFGKDYLNWANVTPVFVPKLKNYRKPNLSFSVKNVLRREYNGFFAVILCLFLLETFGNVIVTGQIGLDTEWMVVLGIGFAIWMTLRTLKKKTSLLKESGR